MRRFSQTTVRPLAVRVSAPLAPRAAAAAAAALHSPSACVHTTTALHVFQRTVACKQRYGGDSGSRNMAEESGDEGTSAMAIPRSQESADGHDDGHLMQPLGEERHYEANESEDEEFDELEAASQELHDLCYAMIAHLRKTDPEATNALFEMRSARRIREPVAEHKRRLLHGHGDRSLFRRNNYKSSKEFEKAHELYMQFGEKMMVLLQKPVLDRLIESAGRRHTTFRRDGVHRFAKPIERSSWRGFPMRWFKHAPFEVQQLRADIPEATVKNTRSMRDLSTLRSLFTLMEPQHPFREQIELRVYQLTSHYDKVANGAVSSQGPTAGTVGRDAETQKNEDSDDARAQH